MTNKITEALTLAEKMAKRHGVRMCDENGDTHGEELYCVGIEDIADIIREALADHIADAGKVIAKPVQEHESREDIAAKEMFEGFSKAWASPVKQEPVAYTNKEQVNELIKESARLIGSIKDEGDQYLTAIDALRNAYRIGLKDSPVDAKAIRAEALEKVVKFLSESGLITPTGRFAAAIRGLK